jgi:hypothetical protein
MVRALVMGFNTVKLSVILSYELLSFELDKSCDKGFGSTVHSSGKFFLGDADGPYFFLVLVKLNIFVSAIPGKKPLSHFSCPSRFQT